MTELLCNDYRPGVQNLSMNVYVIQREALITMVKDATIRGLVYFEKDILARNLELLNVQGYEYTGYTARIADCRTYFEENMRLLDPANLDALFPAELPVYTKVHDNAPTRYAMDSHVKNSVVADGCIIEGDVENCVLFRGVKVKKGAEVKNCVLMQNTIVEPGAHVEYVVTDKDVQISERQGSGRQRQLPGVLRRTAPYNAKRGRKPSDSLPRGGGPAQGPRPLPIKQGGTL